MRSMRNAGSCADVIGHGGGGGSRYACDGWRRARSGCVVLVPPLAFVLLLAMASEEGASW